MKGNLDIEFQNAYKKASDIPQEQLPPDTLLKLYAYYKQATYGDNDPEFIEKNEIDLRNRFKLNAWIQLRGLSIEKSKQEYINIVKNL